MGGFSEAKAQTPEVQHAVDVALASLSAERQSVNVDVTRILRVRKQVVAGINYDLDLEVSTDSGHEFHHFRVYDRFGDVSVTSHTKLDHNPLEDK